MNYEQYENPQERELRIELDIFAEKVMMLKQHLRNFPEDADAKTEMRVLVESMEEKVANLYKNNPNNRFYHNFLLEGHSVVRKERAIPAIREKKERSNLIKHTIRQARRKSGTIFEKEDEME